MEDERESGPEVLERDMGRSLGEGRFTDGPNLFNRVLERNRFSDKTLLFYKR